MKKSISRFLCLFMLFIIAFSMFSLNKLNTMASGSSHESITGTAMTLTSDASMRVAANDNAEIVTNLSAGDIIFVVKEENGWYQVYYKGDYAYVKVSNDSGDSQGTDVATVSMSSTEELDKEFTQKEQLDSTYVESYLIQQRRARIALVWKILIVALVGAIIAVSIVIGVRNSKSGVRDMRNKES